MELVAQASACVGVGTGKMLRTYESRARLPATIRFGGVEVGTGISLCYWWRMIESLRDLLKTRYVRTLEEEVARLRAENRALMNSLLGTAGFPPVDFPETVKPQPLPRLRKRSWQQIQAWRENGSNEVRK